MYIGNFIISCIIIAFSCSLCGQDGSNIRYKEAEVIDKTYVGKYCHLDFGQESFAGKHLNNIKLFVKDRYVKFVERRKDDGFNNWFTEQYLSSYDYTNKWEMRLQNSQIDSVTSERIFLNSTISYYACKNCSAIDTITIVNHNHLKSTLAKVLILDRK